MKRRYVKLARRVVLVVAALPLLQTAGCGAEFIASAIANQAATEVATILATSGETALLNLFGV